MTASKKPIHPSTATELETHTAKAICALKEAERLKGAGDFEGCCEALRLVLSADRLPAAVLNNAGLLLQGLNKLEDADHAFERAYTADPTQEAALVNRGGLLRSRGNWQLALELLMKAVQIKPDSAVAWNNVGMLLRDLKRLGPSASAFTMACRLNQSWALPRFNLGTVLSESGDTVTAASEFRTALSLAPQDPQVFSNLLLCLNYLPNLAPSALVQEHLQYGKRFENDRSATWPNSPEPLRRLKVGFVSGDLGDHSVSWFLEPLLKCLKDSTLECVCFSNAPVQGPVAERLHQFSHGWIDIWGRSHEAAIQLVQQQKIDVLIDLSGHTALNRLPLFAAKPAPIQISMIGYLQTSGLKAMDYRITDRWLSPVDGIEERAGAPETLLRLPNGAFGFRLPTDAPEVAPLPDPDNGIVFASFNSLTKLHPGTVRVWAETLQAVPHSRMIVLGNDPSRLLTQLTAHGIEPGRIEHKQRLPLQDFYKLLGTVHLALDTFPFNGLTVNLLAAWMGVSTVTLAGSTSHGRAGTAVAARLGFPMLSCETEAAYVTTAARIVQDKDLLTEMRTCLRPRIREAFGNEALHAMEFQEALRAVWKQWCASQSGSFAQDPESSKVAN